ncbi:uncharacterized protein TRUGW13939_09587 [Talaromyces rugulosus]|uniref:CENP-V/GFA domain-containing protein n=1 Tax=Talaromyces rugulosus TaxID=121627 RepID=A0A7H8R855_TALRU|nr:uncharacterized protein TRUGW13939_09587 [Talaromyces rugulosus]QKX62426.1 hypothetical protein TRUGW13939_09587 [Talaromyces rugulosus]
MSETSCITCLCGQVSQRVSPTLAESFSVCHCSSCRSTSGVLCTSYLVLNSPPDINKCCLTEYAQSANVSRWFCAVCGAHVFAYAKHADRYYVATGLLETTIPSEQRRVTHWGTRHTRDGGLSRFLQLGNDASANGDVTACLLGPTVANDKENDKNENNGDIHSSRLQARCHCGGVDFSITRPDDIRSRSVWSPWPDLLVPYHSASLREKSNPDDVKWWVCADNTKYLAGTCACTSCRLASGFPIQTWAFVPKTNIVSAAESGTEFEYRSTSATLQCFESSPGVFREFCNLCGATVFWHCSERPGVVDVSVGVLRAQTGARAEDWLDWVTARVSFAEDALGDPLIALLEEGLRAS